MTGPKPAPVVVGKPLPAGIPTFNTDNAAHFSGPAQAFLYAEVHAREILVRELATIDGWKTSRWSPSRGACPTARVERGPAQRSSAGNNLPRPSAMISTPMAARTRPMSRVMTLMPVWPRKRVIRVLAARQAKVASAPTTA